ncbi:MAG: zinc ribbon domain-containing protein [Clostridia bacterium]|nr:zinc ribbon domain-containing protein [Clostridia bacterium]
MFCSQCGTHITDNSIYCSNCGFKVKSDNTIEQKSTRRLTNDERNGMSIYFNDICRLEFIKNALQVKKEEVEKLIENSKTIRCYSKTYFWDHSYGLPYEKRYKGVDNEIMFNFGFDGTDFYFYIQSKQQRIIDEEWVQYYPPIDFKNEHKLTEERLQQLSEPVTREETTWFGKTKKIPVNLWNYTGEEYYSGQASFAADWRPIFLDLLQTAKVELSKDYESAQNNLEQCPKQLTEIEDDLTKASELLKKQYDLNIIPNKFRNLESIWYICDYFDSSTESLSEILVHLDLDEIKEKLDNIIKNQQKIIINQAIQIAQNKSIITQNQEILGRLSSIEHNTEKISQNTQEIANNTLSTTQWSQIAANNAEACAWISMANYIKNI